MKAVNWSGHSRLLVSEQGTCRLLLLLCKTGDELYREALSGSSKLQYRTDNEEVCNTCSKGNAVLIYFT
jgi:hypothetical protein